MNKSNTNNDQDTSSASSSRGRFRPKKKPIARDMPTRQERPAPTPIQKTDAMVEALKPKTNPSENTKTIPKNEPLEIPETLVLGLSGLSLRPGRLHYKVDASGFLDLVRSTYIEYNSIDRYFERTISPAMFEFYCVSAYWLRMYQILFDSGRDVHRTYRQLQQIFPEDFVLPAPIASWLAGVGSFTDPAGRQFELDVTEPTVTPVHEGVRGGFGGIGPTTVPHYACNLAPYPLVYRLYAENCSNTAWINEHYLYKLPGQLTTVEDGVPNSNLLGWAPLVQPHSDIRRQLLRLGIRSTVAAANAEFVTIDTAPKFVRGIPYIPGLVEYISGKLSTYKTIRTVPTIPVNKTGSSTQVGFNEVAHWDGDGAYPREEKVTHGPPGRI